MDTANGLLATQLRILTFNVWGLKYVSSNRGIRIQAIGDIIAGNDKRHSSLSSQSDETELSPENSCPWDVICLQEVWVKQDGLYLKRRAKEGGLEYSRWFHSGALGSGLMIISRFPILSSRILPYPLNGSPLHVIEGDWFVGKGAASAVLDLGPTGGEAEFIVTHFHAPGGDSGEEFLRAHRLAQAWELGLLARTAAEKGRHVFVCGDLNSIPGSLVISLLTSHGSLYDAWQVSHPPHPTSTTPPSPFEAVKTFGVTCDSPLCSYTAGKNLGEIAKRDRGKRLDYILFRPSNYIEGSNLSCTSTQVLLVDPVPGQSYSLSDHFAVEANFTITPEPTTLPPPPPPMLSEIHLKQTIDALKHFLISSRKLAAYHLRVFGGCIIGIPVLAIAASFQPLKYLNWIFVLLGIALGWLGTTMLYVGFVGGRWEEGALNNAIEEMETFRAPLRQGRGA